MGERVIPVRLCEAAVNQIDFLIKEGYYLNRSDFIREAVRYFLINRGFIKEEQISKKKIVELKIQQQKIGDTPISLADDLKKLIE